MFSPGSVEFVLRVNEQLTWLADDRARLQLQHHGDGGDVGGVEDLCAVWQGDRPQLRRGVKHMDPAALAAGDSRAVTFTDQVSGMANDAVASLCLGTLLHFHWHHGVMAHIDDGNIPIMDEVWVLNKTHGEHPVISR